MWSSARTRTFRMSQPAEEQSEMVVRFWSARTTQLRLPDYLRHFNEHVLPHLRAKDGFIEARVLTQSDGVVVEMIVETLWASLEAIERFAGPDRESAVVAEEAVDLLTSYDRRVRHYEVKVRDQHRAKTSLSS
jgi:heme-degrading monooxygenase HmoA